MPGGPQAGNGIHREPCGHGGGKQRVQATQAQYQDGGGVEIASHAGGQRWGGEERVAEGGNGSGDSQQHHYEQADGGEPGGFAAHADQGLPGSPPGGEGEAGEQREGVDEMGGERVNIGVAGHVCGFDEEGADERFGYEEGAGERGGEAYGVLAGEDAPGPIDQDRDERDVEAGGGAMGEFDEGRKAGRMRRDFPVAEGPMVAAAGSGAGGAHVGAP